ncbi:pyridoxal-phosphate dependent enzyme [Nonomuraea sp. NPDC002799]
MRLAGQRTVAYEIADVLGDAPDVHCLPVGNGGNITATWGGYRTYREAGRASTLPRMWGFQAAGSAPLVHGAPVADPRTEASAIRVGNPATWEGAVAAREESGGLIAAVTDEQIFAAYRLLARRDGVFAEPASAAGVAGAARPARARRAGARPADRDHAQRERAEGSGRRSARRLHLHRDVRGHRRRGPRPASGCLTYLRELPKVTVWQRYVISLSGINVATKPTRQPIGRFALSVCARSVIPLSQQDASVPATRLPPALRRTAAAVLLLAAAAASASMPGARAPATARHPVTPPATASVTSPATASATEAAPCERRLQSGHTYRAGRHAYRIFPPTRPARGRPGSRKRS